VWRAAGARSVVVPRARNRIGLPVNG